MLRLASLTTLIAAAAIASAVAGEVPRSAHWSLQPVIVPAVPAAANPVDAFIFARLEKVGLTMSPEADRATLIRRVAFDLTGLPPSPEEVEAFVRPCTVQSGTA